MLIVGASPAFGHMRHYRALIRSAERVIAADAGVELCRAASRVPDVCVGDFDSARPETLAWAEALGARIERHPAEKDESDLDLALAVARKMGCARVTFTAAFSGRLDHTLAALGTLMSSADLGAEADEPEWVAYPLDAAVRACVTLTCEPETTLSVMAIGDGAVVTIAGVKYPLEARRLRPLSSLGLSNVSSDGIQTVTLEEGCAILFVEHKNDRMSLQR